MIRGHVDIVKTASGLVKFSSKPRLVAVTLTKYRHFYIGIEGTKYSFKVDNLKIVYKGHINNSDCVRILCLQSSQYIEMSCYNSKELKVFLGTLENLIQMRQKFIRNIKHGLFYCEKSTFQDIENLVESRSKRWRLNEIQIAGWHRGIGDVTVTRFPCLMILNASKSGLVQVPKSLGSLPCLNYVDLSANKLSETANWDWLTSPFIRENLQELYLDKNNFNSLPEAISGLKKLRVLSFSDNNLSSLPAALGNLKYLRKIYMRNNNLGILPYWLYRKERYSKLSIEGNKLLASTVLHRPRFDDMDFVSHVPSLFTIASKFIITESFPFWEYIIPTTVTDYLEAYYLCRCGSPVFYNTIGRVVKCMIGAGLIIENCDHTIPIEIRWCSTECFSRIERYILF